MAQQNINIGAANQGNGDTLFDAFTKVQENFTELYTDESQGEVNSIVAGTGVSVSSATGDVTVTNTAPDQTVSLADGGDIAVSGTYPSFTLTNSAPNATHTGEVTGATALTIANDVVDFDNLANEFKTSTPIAASEVSFGSAQVFTKTLTAETSFTYAGAEIGMVKDLIINADGNSFSLPTGTKIIAGTPTTGINFIQVVVTATGEYWTSISQQQ